MVKCGHRPDQDGAGTECARSTRVTAQGRAPSHGVSRKRGKMFFSGFDGIWRTAVVGLCAYAALVGVLRITGKRTLSKMNAFDLNRIFN